MKVICAGLGKTGTTSLAKALQVLGYNVYDFPEHFQFHRQEWLDSFETDRHPNFKEIYDGVDAVTDIPPAFWFEEISATFPEAKVILTVRDSEDAWLKSWKEHLQLVPSYAKILIFILPWLARQKHFCDTLHLQQMGPLYVKILIFIFPSLARIKHFFDTQRQAIYGSSNPEATALYRVKALNEAIK